MNSKDLNMNQTDQFGIKTKNIRFGSCMFGNVD